jgi:hypothetical protein
VSIPQQHKYLPFFVFAPWHIAIKLEILYLPWSQEHLSPINIDICFIRSLACKNKLHNKGLGIKISSFYQDVRRSNGCKIKIIKLGHLVTIFHKIFGWWDGCGPCVKFHTHVQLEIIHLRLCKSNFGAHMPLLEAIKVHWLDDVCLSNAIFGAYLRLGVAQTTRKNVLTMGITCGPKNLPHHSCLMDIVQGSSSPHTIVILLIKMNLWDLHLSFSKVYEYITLRGRLQSRTCLWKNMSLDVIRGNKRLNTNTSIKYQRPPWLSPFPKRYNL